MFNFKSLEKSNPRDLIRNSDLPGADILRQRLRMVRYSPRPDFLNDLIEAIDSELSILIEGEPGTGKTLAALSLSKTFGLPLYRVQCMANIDRGKVLGRWEEQLQNQFTLQAAATGASLDEARERQWTFDFFSLGDALSAYYHSSATRAATGANGNNGNGSPAPRIPNLLLIDEIDKLEDEDEDMFLQLLEEGGTNIPRLGFLGLPKDSEPPIVILTSNNLRSGVSSPLRSRCLYTYVEPPNLVEEIVILKTQVPEAGDEQVSQTVKLVEQIRLDKAFIRQPPQLRESVRFLKALVRKRVSDLTPDVIQNHLCYLAKTKADRKQLGDTDSIASNATMRLSDAARTRDPLIDSKIQIAFGEYERQEKEFQQLLNDLKTEKTIQDNLQYENSVLF